ncbi:MAG TPA: phosphoenolpyruvate--protein phosphotransferase [Fibrobacteraceae bacterium]|nr:phosphoenolpyruvate--protein phosphotransferase [Fibrobacteraceae bacterium]
MTGSTKTTTTRKTRLILTGVPASPGFAMGCVQVLVNQEFSVSQECILPERVPKELSLFQKAIRQSIRDLESAKQNIQKRVSKEDARILDTQMMMLQDPMLVDPVVDLVRREHYNARWAFHDRMKLLIGQFEQSPEVLWRERSADLSDLYNRMMNLLVESGPVMSQEGASVETGAILIGHTLNPSHLVKLRQGQATAFATDTGGRTSHVSILARALKIPAVAGLADISVKAEAGDFMIVDGSNGIVIINPQDSDIRKYKAKIEAFRRQEQELLTTRRLDPQTLDGKYIKLMANIELPMEADDVEAMGATGIGLYRSEFLFIQKGNPSCEEQIEAYRYIIHRMNPLTATIRTLDAGGDKIIPELSATDEANPFMGWRSIRVCLDKEDIFKNQLRAILQAGEGSTNLRIMFPMISSVQEIQRAKTILAGVAKALTDQGVQIPHYEVGIMVEVPAAVIMVDELAREVDFFSIGTNDLIQFTLAVDRSNERIASMFQPHHPAVLRMIHHVVQAAHHEGITVSVCGEMVTEPLSTLLLVGLGIDELSMTPWNIMECKKFIRSITYEEARETVHEVMSLPNTEEINRYLKKKYLQKISDLGISSFIVTADFNKNDRALIKVKDHIVNLDVLQ